MSFVLGKVLVCASLLLVALGAGLDVAVGQKLDFSSLNSWNPYVGLESGRFVRLSGHIIFTHRNLQSGRLNSASIHNLYRPYLGAQRSLFFQNLLEFQPPDPGQE
jgi:hypothetical protein